jgi:hypothetical protein
MELANLSARTRRLAIVSTIEDADYRTYTDRAPHSARLAGNRHLAAIRTCMELAARQLGPDERIFYVFEQGGDYEKDAEQFLNEIRARGNLKQKYRYDAHTFISKNDPRCLPMKATDLLAWAFQDQYVRDDAAERNDLDEQPSKLLKALAGDDSARPLHYYPLGPKRLAIESMIRRWVFGD